MVIIVFGLPGSGKSYFATQAAKMLNAIYINSDIIRKNLFRTPAYSAEEKTTVYNEMMKQLKQAINDQKDVVIDATFHKNETRQPFLTESHKTTSTFLIEICAEENLIKERLRKKRKYSDADFTAYNKIKSEWQPYRGSHLILQSTNNNITTMLDQTSDFLFAR